MARKVNRLDSKKVERAKPKRDDGKPTVLPDGANLYLQVSRGTNGDINKSWLFKYQFGHCRHELGLGWYPKVGLSAARELARHFSTEIAKGIDPIIARREAKAEAKRQHAERTKAISFKQCVEMYLKAHAKKNWHPKHRQQWENTLAVACETLGKLAVADIQTAHVVKALRPVWDRTPVTAERLRGRIESVLGFATVSGFRTGDNPARWRNHLKELFPAASQVRDVEHHAALPYANAPGFMAELRQHQSALARAVEFTILTACRSGDVVDARWNQIDLADKLWTIPKTKNGRAHRVPLSKRAVEILKAMPRDSASVFRGLRNNKMLEFLQTMRPDVTLHGFRSTFRDWAAECTAFPEMIAEMALAHSVGSKVEKAYKRTDLLAKRANLMRDWASFLDRPLPASATVTPIRQLADA
jgi:integrase